MSATPEIVNERVTSARSLKSTRSIPSARLETKRIEQLEIIEPTKINQNAVVNTGFFVTNKLLILISVVIGTMLIGSILATHFGTKANIITV